MTTQPENKAEGKITTDELTDKELNQVSGGTPSVRAPQNDPAEMFQQILQQLTQGQG